MLNGLWLGFFLAAALSAGSRWLLGGDASVFAAMVESLKFLPGIRLLG